MDTPIYDFVSEYCGRNPARFHMPGHKGVDSCLGVEHLDITEIEGAGNLWDEHACTDIIARSEANASALFGCHTFYSTEGSSLAIRGMLFLIKKWAFIHGVKPFILAGRNAHKTFVNTAAILGIDVRYLTGKSCEAGDSYMSCNITAEDIKEQLKTCCKAGNCKDTDKRVTDKPVAVYITSPDYLGNMLDIEGIARVCHEYGVFLLVDNAHGAYLRFLNKSLHPIDLGADMCCDSAHKTLPVLTGGAYLHVSHNADSFFAENARNAMGMFGSTSPSYLILQSLDLCNRYLSESFKTELEMICGKCAVLKEELENAGYSLVGSEPIKLTIDAASYGYAGYEIADILMKNDIYPEHVDDDFVVFMVSVLTTDEDLKRLKECLKVIPKGSSLGNGNDPADDADDIPKGQDLKKYPESGEEEKCFEQSLGNCEMAPYEAMLSDSEYIPSADSVGRILAQPIISCPPCVPEYMAGERITSVPSGCEYVRVVKETMQPKM